MSNVTLIITQAERGRKALAGELSEAAERVNEVSVANAHLAGQRRKAEGELEAVRGEVDELGAELKGAEERVRKAESDASRLAAELANEQVNCL